jgi:hypothetical protein
MDKQQQEKYTQNCVSIVIVGCIIVGTAVLLGIFGVI